MDSESLSTFLTGLNLFSFLGLFVIATYLRFTYQRLEELVSIVSRMDSFNLNLARDIGNRFANVDDALSGLDSAATTVASAHATLLGSVSRDVSQIPSSLRGFGQALDTFRESHVSALRNVETPLNQVHEIVTAFKNDLSTQVRLSREDYEELMATAESKNADFPQQLNDLRLTLTALQTQLSDFRNKFDAFTE